MIGLIGNESRNKTTTWFISADSTAEMIKAKEREGDRIVFVEGMSDSVTHSLNRPLAHDVDSD